MDKRLPLALFLSFLVLFGWTLLFPPEPPPTPPPGAGDEAAGGAVDVAPLATGTGATAPSEGDEPAAPAGPAATVFAAEEETHEVVVGRPGEPGYYRIVFTNRGGRVSLLTFGDYYRTLDLGEAQRADPANWLPLVEPIETAAGRRTASLGIEVSPSSRPLAPQGLEDVLWRMEPLEGERPGVEFRYGPGTGVVFTKRIRAVPGTWHLELELEVENEGQEVLGRRELVLNPASVVEAELGESFYLEPRAVAAGWDEGDEDYDHDSIEAGRVDPVGETLDAPAPLAFVGVHNKYFAYFLRGADAAATATLAGARVLPVEPVAPIEGENGEKDFLDVRVPLRLDLPGPGETRSWRYVIYAGPKDRDVMIADFEPHKYAVEDDLGFFSGISNLLLTVMGFFHRLTGNWGWSIILLTICVRLVLFRSTVARRRRWRAIRRR